MSLLFFSTLNGTWAQNSCQCKVSNGPQLKFYTRQHSCQTESQKGIACGSSMLECMVLDYQRHVTYYTSALCHRPSCIHPNVSIINLIIHALQWFHYHFFNKTKHPFIFLPTLTGIIRPNTNPKQSATHS